MKQVYKIDAEITRMPGSPLPDDSGGGFVSVFVRDTSDEAAIEQARAELLRDCYKPVEITGTRLIKPSEFGNGDPEQGDPSKMDLQNLGLNGGVIYGAFFLYPKE